MENLMASFNRRAEEIGHALRISEERRAACEAVSPSGQQAGLAFPSGKSTSAEMKDTKNRVYALTRDGLSAPRLGMVANAEGTEIALICQMDAVSACDGLVAFSTLIDVTVGGSSDADVKWRNDVLKRLHLFDGGLSTGKPKTTRSRSADFSVRTGLMAKGLMRFGIHMG